MQRHLRDREANRHAQRMTGTVAWLKNTSGMGGTLSTLIILRNIETWSYLLTAWNRKAQRNEEANSPHRATKTQYVDRKGSLVGRRPTSKIRMMPGHFGGNR